MPCQSQPASKRPKECSGAPNGLRWNPDGLRRSIKARFIIPILLRTGADASLIVAVPRRFAGRPAS
jgi:hypothetical protein